jgi:hypothetical protein
MVLAVRDHLARVTVRVLRRVRVRKGATGPRKRRDRRDRHRRRHASHSFVLLPWLALLIIASGA